MSTEENIVVPPTTTVYCPERGEGWTLTGITGRHEFVSVMFDGTRYSLPATLIIDELLPNQLQRAAKD